MIVVGVDPGKVTGVSWLMFPANDHKPDALQREPMSAVRVVHRTLESTGGMPALVACASYVPPGQLTAIEVTGALRYLCTLYDVEFTLQSSDDADEFASDDKLNRLGWRKHQDVADSSLRHLLLAAIRRNLISLEVFV